MIVALPGLFSYFFFYQICSNDDPRMTFDFLMARSNLRSHMDKCLYGENVEKLIPQNVLKTNA